MSRLLDDTRLVTLAGCRMASARPGWPSRPPPRWPRGSFYWNRPDGIWLVEFAGVRGGTAADLAQVVATTLGVRDDAPAPPGTGGGAGPASPVHRLATALRDRRTLLVLDNCEHVVDAAAELAELLLRTAPDLRVLATSQEPLGLTGEAVFLVEPLPTDDAVRLFSERAAAHDPGFPATRAAATSPTARPSPRSAAGWTASRSPWNSPPPACAPWGSGSWRPGWATGSGS